MQGEFDGGIALSTLPAPLLRGGHGAAAAAGVPRGDGGRHAARAVGRCVPADGAQRARLRARACRARSCYLAGHDARAHDAALTLSFIAPLGDACGDVQAAPCVPGTLLAPPARVADAVRRQRVVEPLHPPVQRVQALPVAAARGGHPCCRQRRRTATSSDARRGRLAERDALLVLTFRPMAAPPIVATAGAVLLTGTMPVAGVAARRAAAPAAGCAERQCCPHRTRPRGRGGGRLGARSEGRHGRCVGGERLQREVCQEPQRVGAYGTAPFLLLVFDHEETFLRCGRGTLAAAAHAPKAAARASTVLRWR